ncbi:uncharacterized protein [Haliotis asinina]|uniref:uncharacterized protein n=1 Tax=Haliotis asinina TaxID=109174 RepID=UPI0035319662
MSSRSKTSSKRNGVNGNGHSDDPKAQWSTQAYLLEDLSERFTLPQVVRCTSTLLTTKDKPLPVNLTQPMLLFETRSVRQLLARNVMYDPRIRKYNETDETIVIPSEYEGRFVRLKSRTAKDHTVHRSIESLVACRVPAFLNLTNITAFHLSAPNRNSSDYPRVEYTPGNVFIIDKVVMGATKVKPDPKVIRAKNTLHVQEVHYLKCRDERENDVIIAINHPGEFTEILPNPVMDGKLSLRSADIITSQKFPMVVRYVYGGNKPRLTQFSGLFTLLDSFEERTVVACVLNASGFTLIEIPLSSPLSFQLALNSHDLFPITLMKNATRLCEKKAPMFKRDIKFKFKFAQQIQEIGEHVLDRSISGESVDMVPPSARYAEKLGITQTYFYL